MGKLCIKQEGIFRIERFLQLRKVCLPENMPKWKYKRHE